MKPVFPSAESRHRDDDDLLSLYLAGKLEASAAARVEQWMNRHAGARETVHDFVQGASAADLQPPDMTPVLRALEERMDASETSTTIPPVKTLATRVIAARIPRGGRHQWIALGAASLVVAAVFGGWMTNRFSTQPDASASMSTYTTPNGQRSTITLPDGSSVILNVASRLEVPTDYNNGHRTIRLEGEAFFDVVGNRKLPFVVMTPRSATRVLGTTFVVREYSTDSVTTVAVQSGEVAVRNVVVSRQQQVKINRNGMARLSPAAPTVASFTSGVLALNGVPLSEAILDLGRWYDVEIRLNDPQLRTQGITGKFAMGSLNDLIAILQMTFDVRVVREGRVLTLYSE